MWRACVAPLARAPGAMDPDAAADPHNQAPAIALADEPPADHGVLEDMSSLAIFKDPAARIAWAKLPATDEVARLPMPCAGKVQVYPVRFAKAAGPGGGSFMRLGGAVRAALAVGRPVGGSDSPW